MASEVTRRDFISTIAKASAAIQLAPMAFADDKEAQPVRVDLAELIRDPGRHVGKTVIVSGHLENREEHRLIRRDRSRPIEPVILDYDSEGGAPDTVIDVSKTPERKPDVILRHHLLRTQNNAKSPVIKLLEAIGDGGLDEPILPYKADEGKPRIHDDAVEVMGVVREDPRNKGRYQIHVRKPHGKK